MYEIIFYDSKGSPKLKKWLVKKGVKYNKLNELTSIMIEVFMKSLEKYKHDKIDFEKYVWVRFGHALNNYFYRYNHIKKIINEVSLDELNEREGCNVEFYIIDNDMITNIDFNIDIDLMIKNFNNIQSFIFKCKYYNSWNDLEVQNWSDVLYPNEDYYKELGYVKSIIDLYIKL